MTQNPFTAVFDAQRTAIEQTQTLTHDAIEAQQRSFTAFADALETSGDVLEGNADLTKRALHAYFDAVEANLPEEAADIDELRTLVDDGVDTVTETQQESIDTLVEAVEETAGVHEEFATETATIVDSSFDSFLDAHHQTEANVAEVVESVEESTDEFDVSA